MTACSRWLPRVAAAVIVPAISGASATAAEPPPTIPPCAIAAPAIAASSMGAVPGGTAPAAAGADGEDHVPPAGAADPASSSPTAPCLPSEAELENDGAVIGRIYVVPEPIFDPDDPREDHLLYHLANRLHRTTRPAVIEQQLLFDSGDPYSSETLAESERLLRHDRYIYDAEVRPVGWDGRAVDVAVVTRDVWTLNAGLGVGRKGGANSTRFLLQDTNLLGTGKSVTLERTFEVDRDETLFRYDDAHLRGSHAALTLGYSLNSDGDRRLVSFGRPFYSLASRWAAAIDLSDDDRVDPLYRLGHVADRFRHRQRAFTVSGGLSAGLEDGWANRWSAGFTYRDDGFLPVGPESTGGVAGDRDLPATLELPADRTLAYPWVAFDSVADTFVEVHDQDQMQRTEDLYLGRRLHGRLGLAAGAFGSSETAAVFDGSAGAGWRPRPGHTLVLSSDLAGRWGSDGLDNTLLSGRVRYYWRDWGEQLLFATVEGDLARDLDPENQLLLGGDSGLRGYPLRYQTGDRRFLFSLEQRLFTDLYPFRLFHVGAAAFLDVGRTWSDRPDAADLGWLRDVGVGLRLSNSRSGLGSVLHLDLAFPLDGDGSIQSVQYLISTKASL